MKTSVLSSTALIIGLGLFGSSPQAMASVALQNLARTEQDSAFILSQRLGQPFPNQPRRSQEDLRRDRRQEIQNRLRLPQQETQQQQRDVFERQQLQQRHQDALEQQRQQRQNALEQQLRQRQQEVLERQQQQNVFEQQRQQQNVLERQRQQNVLERRQHQQDALNRQRQEQQLNVKNLQQISIRQQRQRLEELRARQLADRKDREDLFKRQLSQQRVAWQLDRNRDRNSWLQQQNLIERRLNRIDVRQQELYRNYVTYHDYDYWNDHSWRNRDYWDDRSFWSNSGYWYERDYWSRRGYFWDDILGGILQGLISGLVQGAIVSSYSPYRPASDLYYRGSQILSYNGLTQAVCEPGNIVILLPNRRVMCAIPTYSFVPGTYRLGSSGLGLIPAEVQYY